MDDEDMRQGRFGTFDLVDFLAFGAALAGVIAVIAAVMASLFDTRSPDPGGDAPALLVERTEAGAITVRATRYRACVDHAWRGEFRTTCVPASQSMTIHSDPGRPEPHFEDTQ